MLRFLMLMCFAADAVAAMPAVDIDTAAKIYQDAGIRQQVRASLPTMPNQIRKIFADNGSAKLSDEQLAAVTTAAERAFRIDVFEAPALNALAANLDPLTVKKAEAFFATDYGRRMVEADVALASLDEAQTDKIMEGEITAPSTPAREVIFDRLERAERSSESTVRIFLNMGSAVAVGTAVGSGMDVATVEARAKKSGEDSRHLLEENMREPLRRYLAYGYRDMSDSDLKHILSFLNSAPGKHYTAAYIESLGAGFDAMGRRCGEELGESLRELAQAQAANSSLNLKQKSPEQ